MPVEDSEVDQISAAVERAVPRGPVAVVIRTTDFGLTFFGVPVGVAWQLKADGWLPTEPMAIEARSAFFVPPHTRSPTVVITVQDGHVGSKITVCERHTDDGGCSGSTRSIESAESLRR